MTAVETETPTDHPARFSAAVLEAVQPYLDDEAVRRFGPDSEERLLIWDPFAGPGGIHALHDDTGDLTWGGELEWEWACQHPRNLVADALHPPFRPGSFHVVLTSPCYGNRFADTYAGDAKNSKRYSYRIYLGRMPSSGSAAVMQWGKKYRAFHAEAFAAAVDLLDDEGLLICNISNHMRTLVTGEPSLEMHVVEWYLSLFAGLGLRLVAAAPVGTPRMAHGQNHEKRAEAEFLLVFRKPTAAEWAAADKVLAHLSPVQSLVRPKAGTLFG